MWTNRNYDDLLTFAEFIDQFGSEDLYEETEFANDDVTMSALYEWFFYRKVVDNERFKRYFHRALNIYERQYYQRLRLEFTDFDPMVTSYVERQILRSESRSGRSSKTGTDTTTGRRNGTNSTTGTGSSTTNTESETNANGRTTGTSSDSGSTSGTSNTDTKNLHGETPQSAVGSSGGMPNNLDWTYLSSQDQTKANNTTTGTTTANGQTAGTSNDHSESEGTSTTNSTTGSTGQFNETNSGTVTHEAGENNSENVSGDDRERMTGRQEAPQDLLDRARDYITRTNAFMWLVDRLDECFMQIFDM